MAGIQVPEGALKSEPALANNVIPGRPKTPGKQGALQRARQMASTSAEQLLTASSTPGASLVKGQSVIRGAFLVSVVSLLSTSRVGCMMLCEAQTLTCTRECVQCTSMCIPHPSAHLTRVAVYVQLVHRMLSAANPVWHDISLCRKRVCQSPEFEEEVALHRLSRPAAKIRAATGASAASRTSSGMCKRIGDEGERPLVEPATAAHLHAGVL